MNNHFSVIAETLTQPVSQIFSKTFLKAVLVLLAGTALSPKASAKSFCVQTLNAYGPIYATDIEERTETLVKTMAERQPCSIVQLQEVWMDFHKTKFRQLTQQHLPEMDFYTYTFQNDELMTGLATLTRESFGPAQRKLYDINYDGGFGDGVRGALDIHKAFSWLKGRATSSPADTVFLYNTHLHHNSSTIRLTQVLQLGKQLNQDRYFEKPVILTGDFNFEPRSLEWRLLTKVFGFSDAFRRAASEKQKGQCTYCADNPMSWNNNNRRIDYVFSRSSRYQYLKPLDTQITYKAPVVSDHYGLQTTFELVRHRRTKQRPLYAAGSSQRDILKAVISRLESKADNEQYQKYLQYARSLLAQIQ